MNNRQLNNIISEEINRYTLRQQVRAIVSEEVNRYIDNLVNETSRSIETDKSKNRKTRKGGKKKSKVTDSMRAEVTAWLQSADFVLDSQVAYELFGGGEGTEEGDAARSLFAKKKHNKDGHAFNDDETLKLYQIKNSISS